MANNPYGKNWAVEDKKKDSIPTIQLNIEPAGLIFCVILLKSDKEQQTNF